MSVLLASANPLFREVLSVSLRQAGLGPVEAEPEGEEERIQRQPPGVLLLEGGLSPTLLARWPNLGMPPGADM